MRRTTLAAILVFSSAPAVAQERAPFTRADTLRGSLTPERTWWDVSFYDLHVTVQPADSSIRGRNGITYRVLGPAREMQIDLQPPLEVDSVMQDGTPLDFRRDGDAFFVTPATPQQTGERRTVTVYYHGQPRVAKHAPWDGGFVWTTDSLGRTVIATACQGLGASVWWPNKDTQADEPDSQRVAITVPDPLVNVSNGRLRSVTHGAEGTTWEWFVTRPINNYDIAVNAAVYAHFGGIYDGEGGPLTLDYWALKYRREAARRQFKQVRPMLACFERWFGPYPWYEDGYKLVETPHLGMEHQSAVAYGNHYQNGYLGKDLSGTGTGLDWDFIIVHESAHEWWGNSLTTADIADMWVHESFANYSENLYVECLHGPAAGATYVEGTRKKIKNDATIVGEYGVNREGSGDMYYKGGNMLHTIRHVVADDTRWRETLRGLQSSYRHQVVTGRQVEEYISRSTGIDFTRVFDQYLRTTEIPVLEYRLDGAALAYRWVNVVPGFDMPVRVRLAGTDLMLHPTEQWQEMPATHRRKDALEPDRNFYVGARQVSDAAGTPAAGAAP